MAAVLSQVVDRWAHLSGRKYFRLMSHPKMGQESRSWVDLPHACRPLAPGTGLCWQDLLRPYPLATSRPVHPQKAVCHWMHCPHKGIASSWPLPGNDREEEGCLDPLFCPEKDVSLSPGSTCGPPQRGLKSPSGPGFSALTQPKSGTGRLQPGGQTVRHLLCEAGYSHQLRPAVWAALKPVSPVSAPIQENGLSPAGRLLPLQPVPQCPRFASRSVGRALLITLPTSHPFAQVNVSISVKSGLPLTDLRAKSGLYGFKQVGEKMTVLQPLKITLKPGFT